MYLSEHFELVQPPERTSQTQDRASLGSAESPTQETHEIIDSLPRSLNWLTVVIHATPNKREISSQSRLHVLTVPKSGSDLRFSRLSSIDLKDRYITFHACAIDATTDEIELCSAAMIPTALFSIIETTSAAASVVETAELWSM